VSIGPSLTDARERAGLTVDQVAAATRIRRTLVEDMERDDFSRCGGDFYARGHLRNVARVVGLDPAPLLEDFDAERAQQPAPRPVEVFEPVTRAERRGPNWSAAMAAALVLVLVYGVAQVLGGGGDDRGPDVAAPSVSAPGPASTSAGPSSAPAEESAVAQAPRRRVTVAVRAQDRSWLQASDASGETLFEGLVEGGSVRTFTNKRLVRLVIGDAGAVRLTVNGTPIGTPGDPGEVVRVEFGRNDPAAG
jgi:cytoskeletal protein RodZ